MEDKFAKYRNAPEFKRDGDYLLDSNGVKRKMITPDTDRSDWAKVTWVPDQDGNEKVVVKSGKRIKFGNEG